jgi:probable DNA metabolism protein
MLRQATFVPTFAGWQRAARAALLAGTPPDSILWQELGHDQPLLDLADEAEPAQPARSAVTVPKKFVEIATRVACHRDPQRWSLLYRVLWRLTRGERELLAIVVDPDVHALAQMDKAIRHDVHKMRAFVRFRAVEHGGATWYVAWFEPMHHIVELNAPFFIDRFAQMNWSILTPDRCAHWDGAKLSFTKGVPKSEAPLDDAVESLWQKYYASIFNPARVKVHAMQAEMPKRYWKNLPEAQLIPTLLREAPARVSSMMAKSRVQAAADFHPAPVPESNDWAVVKKAACACTACPLYKQATQTVFGEGSAKAQLVFIGEQPGDSEDSAGHPFIGPAGKLLDRALADAGIDRRLAYVTNAVKHFKWTPSGKRRLHKTASPREIAACRPWLEAEMRIVQPKVVVCLGGTAAHSVLGPDVRVLRDRGKFVKSDFCDQTMVTVHPSSLLRAPDEATREENYQLFVADLRRVAMASDKWLARFK